MVSAAADGYHLHLFHCVGCKATLHAQGLRDVWCVTGLDREEGRTVALFVTQGSPATSEVPEGADAELGIPRS